jgi:hypothetical protein
VFASQRDSTFAKVLDENVRGVPVRACERKASNDSRIARLSLQQTWRGALWRNPVLKRLPFQPGELMAATVQVWAKARVLQASRLLAAGATILAASPVLAAESMICENPRREYHVMFDGSKLIVNKDDLYPTRYRVASIARRGKVVSGKTTGSKHDPSYEADFSKRRMKFFVGGKLYQTDECR